MYASASRRWLVPSLVCAATWLSPACLATEAKPNVLVIVADDLGYADLSCQGETDVPTPNIDSIARNGVRFTSGYVTCPVCSPTRAGLLSGRYQQRFGHENNPGPADLAAANFGLPLSVRTLADRMKAAGYATGLVGKWHLGYRPPFHPRRRGFDEFFGFLGGARSYFPGEKRDGRILLRGETPVEVKEYLTDAIGRESVAFLRRHQREPFLLLTTFNAVHAPLEAPARSEKAFASIKNPRRRAFAGMLDAMDQNVGRILAALRELDLEKNTLVVFLSDNGGPTLQTSSRNDPLRGYKGEVWEGGIRVPFLAQWKGTIPAGKVEPRPVSSLDIAATALAHAGPAKSEDQPLDGVDLVPYLTGAKSGDPHTALYWRFGKQSAVRKGDFKLVRLPGEPAKLFDLSRDIGEANDLSQRLPEKLRELDADLAGWDAELVPPAWEMRRPHRDRANRKSRSFD